MAQKAYTWEQLQDFADKHGINVKALSKYSQKRLKDMGINPKRLKWDIGGIKKAQRKAAVTLATME